VDKHVRYWSDMAFRRLLDYTLLMDEPAAKDCRPPEGCAVCGGYLAPVKGGRRRVTCSPRCKNRLKRDRWKAREAAGAPRQVSCGVAAKTYECLCCGVGFVRKRYASGAYSRQTKYCTRECAFEHSRTGIRKRPEVQERRRHESLADWFLSWGDDVYPVVSVCGHCGGEFRRTRSEDKGVPASLCFECKFTIETFPCKRCGEQCDKKHKLHKAGCCSACRLEQKRRRKNRQREKWGRNDRKRCRKYGVPYTHLDRKQVFARDNWECQLCGNGLLRKYTRIDGVVEPLSPTIDHIIPLSLGPGVSPGHVWGNVQAACWECNTRKGADPDFKGD
jgi:5-methylcytosine-specific restriction endonuclease McrA